MNKKLLVIGGTGFIGNHVVEYLLKQGLQIICLTRQNVSSNHTNLEYLQCDLKELKHKNQESLRSKIGKVDSIIYLGASIPLANKKKEDLIAAKENNLDAFLYFLESLGDLANKIIFTSTIDIYGHPNKIDFKEDTAIKPLTTYAIAKYACEKYLEFYCNINKKTYVILRLAQVYGPHEPKVRVISFIIDAVLNDKEFTLTGSGNDKRKFVYVEDVSFAIDLALSYPGNNIVHIAGKEEISIRDAIKIVEKVTNKKIQIRQVNPQQEPLHILPNCDKAYNELGFKPKFSFEMGIKNIMNRVLKVSL